MPRLWILAALALAAGARADTKIDFNRDVRPILSDNCFACHGPDPKTRKADLRLDTRDGALAVLDLKAPAESDLLKRITTTDKSEVMPPPKSDKKLTAAQVATLKAWVAQGAEYQGHWAFLPPKRPAVPAGVHPIDHFLSARLAKEGLKSAPEADRATLIRRVTFDLTGLPPTPKEVDDFLADKSSEAYAKVIERLTGSVRYGERMALDWLDAARYADTNGYHIDNGRDMTKWREWVIDAFHKNKRFDEFTVEQLAGDLLPGATLSQKIASGFNRNHMINFEGGAIPEEYQTAYVIDRVNTTATVWMGLTVACAQCHDHKYDPISQKDFYRLYAFFNNVPERGLDGNQGNASPKIKLSSPEQDKRLAALRSDLAAAEAELKGPLAAVDAAQAAWEKAEKPKGLPANIEAIWKIDPAKRTDAQKAELRAHYRTKVSPEAKKLADRVAAMKKQVADAERAIPDAMVMEEMPKPRDTFLLIRGEYDKKGEKVTAGTPGALPALPAKPQAANRLDLAKWLISPEHPLTARVTANRYWQMFFGTGLVKTAEDFGTQGEYPSHPELLDWLAVEFRESGWDVKKLLTLIVTSAAYRQSAAVPKELHAKDPENRLLARGPRFRLQAEFLRDQALAISGLLNGEVGGKSVSPYQPPGLWEELMSRADGANWTAQTYKQSHGQDLYRRTMYTFWKRTCPPASLAALDAPDRETCVVRRSRTNTPLQALVLMNDPTYVEAARKLAERMMKEGGDTPDARIAFAFKLATARPPKPAETAVLKRVFEAQRARFAKDQAAAMKLLKVGEAPRDEKLDATDVAAWAMVANTVLNLDEVLTRN
ncbi:MAG TPA: PSD1 and planctomycete cytochrome C domain-containing protein [Gemmataceae bacterium]|nr:PSD1 and planctomycete cytochrome C domain-containing protein [Gemmataceae bacterium]